MARRSELSKQGVDRGWPHQVEIDAERSAGHRYDEVHRFAAELSAAPRGGRGRYLDGRHYLRFAFLTPDAADKFQARFGGRRLTVQKASGRWRDEYLAVPIEAPSGGTARISAAGTR